MDEIKQRMQFAKQLGWSDDDIQRSLGVTRRVEPVRQITPKRKKGFWEDQISTGGGIAGALAGGAAGASLGSVVPIVGTAAGGILGALIGGATGGGAGQVAENAYTGEKDLFKDVGKEALMNGVFGAGPIRAGSLALRTAKGLSQGAGKDALSQAGAKAITDRPIRNALSKSLTGASDNMAVRSIGANSAQLTKFQKKFGEDVVPVITRNNLIGKDLESVISVRNKLDSQFGNLVKGAGTVDKETLAASLKKAYEPLLKSTSLDKQAVGRSVQTQADTILKSFNDNAIPAPQLNKIRSEFDSLVNYTQKAANPDKYGVNQKIANVLRETVQQAPGANGLKETGMEISKLRQIEDILQSQGNRGRGTNPISITEMIAAGGGGTLAGIPGALATAATVRAANSPIVKRSVAQGLSGMGQKMLKNSSGLTVGGIAGRVGGAGLATSLAGNQLSEGMNQDIATMASPSNMQAPNPNMNSNMDTLYQNGQDMSMAEPSIGGYTKSEIEAAMVQAATEGNSKAYSQLEDIYSMLPESTDPMADLSQSSRNALASSDNAINTVDQLQALYDNAGGARGRLGGMLGDFAADVGFDSKAKSYNSLSQASVTQIAKALAGSGAGTVSDMDAKVIIAALPTLQDTPEEARTKFMALRQRLDNARQNTLLYGGGQEQQQQQAAF